MVEDLTRYVVMSEEIVVDVPDEVGVDPRRWDIADQEPRTHPANAGNHTHGQVRLSPEPTPPHHTHDTHGTIRIQRVGDAIRPVMIDAMSREVKAGDILHWRSGGYFGHYLAFGLVTKVDYDSGCIKMINHNKNRITMWQTHRCVILARADNYEMIPEQYLKLWFPDQFRSE